MMVVVTQMSLDSEKSFDRIGFVVGVADFGSFLRRASS